MCATTLEDLVVLQVSANPRGLRHVRKQTRAMVWEAVRASRGGALKFAHAHTVSVRLVEAAVKLGGAVVLRHVPRSSWTPKMARRVLGMVPLALFRVPKELRSARVVLAAAKSWVARCKRGSWDVDVFPTRCASHPMVTSSKLKPLYSAVPRALWRDAAFVAELIHVGLPLHSLAAYLLRHGGGTTEVFHALDSAWCDALRASPSAMADLLYEPVISSAIQAKPHMFEAALGGAVAADDAHVCAQLIRRIPREHYPLVTLPAVLCALRAYDVQQGPLALQTFASHLRHVPVVHDNKSEVLAAHWTVDLYSGLSAADILVSARALLRVYKRRETDGGAKEESERGICTLLARYNELSNVMGAHAHVFARALFVEQFLKPGYSVQVRGTAADGFVMTPVLPHMHDPLPSEPDVWGCAVM